MLQSETIRYRMTVQVETPQGLRSGSSVIETSVRPSGPLSAVAVNYSYRGEAVVVDLPQGKTLFALLQSHSGIVDAATRYPAFAFEKKLPRAAINAANLPWLAEYRALKQFGGETAALPFPKPGDEIPVPGGPDKPWPLLVTFTDIRDPKTVARVDPADLAATFGPGVKLRRITVQITDDPVTTGIEKRLKWLDHLDDYRTDQKNPFTNTLPTEIGGFTSNSK